LLNTTGLDEVLAEELAILPGMEEISLLLYINKYVRENKFDVILLDCAPTGESLRFISIPTTLDWYMRKVFSVERSLVKYVRPMAQRVYDVPLPDDKYFQAIADLFEQLKGVDKILADPVQTTARLITNPEKIVLKETQRAFMYFCLHKMSTDAIIMNRIFPDRIKDAYFENWMTDQKQYIEEAKSFFSPLPVLTANLFQGEILGYKNLKDFALQIYGKKNPLNRFYKETPFTLNKENSDYRLRLKLPYIQKEDVILNKAFDELIVRIGGFKQHILLPRQVASLDDVIAKFEGEYLNIIFKGDNHGEKEE
jgi:arsenite-transporting ATPase